ncbi:unnamed protein product [Phytophthora fragariaefolia]|uniref:Unnamed protein product n=1 Tax=Phytophthora fragariaefolia TaxID=1490495 RepID=A0A9W6TK58_9STRA|nr:unnamed protein product [Phytophthora fragariaefolia]
MLIFDDSLIAAHVVSMRASIAHLEEQTSRWRSNSLENERLLQAAQQTIAGHHQDREAIIQDRDSIARDRDALAQDREVIVSDYLRLQEQYSNAYRRMWAIATVMGQDVHLPAPSSFATYSTASSTTAGRAHKSQRTDAASSAPRDVLDLRPQSPVRKNYPSGDSAQIDDSMSSASDDGNRNTADAAAEIDRPPEPSKGPDISPSSDSKLQEVEPEIALQNVSDTTLPEIAGSDKREAVEEKEETKDDGTDNEVLSALSRSRSSLRRRGSLPPGHRALHPIIDKDGDGDSPSGSSSGNSGNVGWYPASHPHPDSYEDLITGATVDALMDTSPWSKLSNGEAPLTFIPAVSGRRLPPNFVQDYLELEERHLQSYWESTHFLPVSEAMYSTDPALSTYPEQRRKRRNRAGAACSWLLIAKLHNYNSTYFISISF